MLKKREGGKKKKQVPPKGSCGHVHGTQYKLDILMLMRGSRECNLNSVDIYCQAVLIHRQSLAVRGLLSTSGPRAQEKDVLPLL